MEIKNASHESLNIKAVVVLKAGKKHSIPSAPCI